MESISEGLLTDQALIGSLLLGDLSTIDIAKSVGITENMFHYKEYGTMYKYLCQLREENINPDPVLLKSRLETAGYYPLPISLAMLMQCQEATSGVSYAEGYAKSLKDSFTKRSAVDASIRLQTFAKEWAGDGRSLLLEMEKTIYELSERIDGGALESDHISESVQSTLLGLSQDKTGIGTGFRSIDVHTCGVRPGEVCVIAARPSNGKSTIGRNIAHHNAVKQGIPTAFCSFEMSKEELTSGFLAAMSGVNTKKFRIGDSAFDPAERKRVADSARELIASPLYLADTRGWRLSSLRTYLRRAISLYGIEVVILDYLQRIKGDGGKGENRQKEVGEISRSIADMSLEFGIPIFALAQLNRESFQRMDKRPSMNDLRESGDIEQDASIICLLYPDTDAWEQMGNPSLPVPTQVLIEKNRGADTGTALLQFDKVHGRFLETSYK